MDVHGDGQVVAQVFGTAPEHAVRGPRDQDFPGIIQAELVRQGKQVVITPSSLVDGQQMQAKFVLFSDFILSLS
jgi:virulence-associated protein VagC